MKNSNGASVKYAILGTSLINYNVTDLLRKIKSHQKIKKNLLLAALPINQIVVAYLNNRFKKILNSFDCLVADTMWVKWSVNFLYNTRMRDRIRGTDLTLKICKLAEERGYRLFFYGSTISTLRMLKLKLYDKFPLLKFVGIYSPPFTHLNTNNKIELINRLSKNKVDILFIALGTPKQEFFAYDLLYSNPRFKKPLVVIPVGAVFDFISGNKKQAPKFLQDTGFEWMFRLIQEPKRLWKRYLLYGPTFIILIIWQKIMLTLNALLGNFSVVKEYK